MIALKVDYFLFALRCYRESSIRSGRAVSSTDLPENRRRVRQRNRGVKSEKKKKKKRKTRTHGRMRALTADGAIKETVSARKIFLERSTNNTLACDASPVREEFNSRVN